MTQTPQKLLLSLLLGLVTLLGIALLTGLFDSASG